MRRLIAISAALVLTGIFVMAYAGDDAAPADPSDEDVCCCDCQVQDCTGDCTDCGVPCCGDEHLDCTCGAADEEGCTCGGETEDCRGDCTECDASHCVETGPDFAEHCGSCH